MLAKLWLLIILIFLTFLWHESFPLRSPDSLFYDQPRFVTHIDDPAIAALTKYYSKVFPPSNTPGVNILDMCSSWVRCFLFWSFFFFFCISYFYWNQHYLSDQPFSAWIQTRTSGGIRIEWRRAEEKSSKMHSYILC